MRIGTMRHPITIEAPSATQNEYGEPVEVWTPFAESYAAKDDLTGREAFLAQQVKAEITTRFTLRHIAGVTAKMRVRCQNVLYPIEVAAVDNRGRYLTLTCSRDG